MGGVYANYRRRLITSVMSQRSDNVHELVALDIIGPSSFSGRQVQYEVMYQPADTDETDVLWEIKEGALYASIDQTGLLTINPNAYNAFIKIQCTSTIRSTVFVTKNVNVTYNIPATGVTISGPSEMFGIKNNELSATISPTDASNTSVLWSITSGNQYAVINEDTGVVSILTDADNSPITVRATSMSDSSVYAEKQINVTFMASYVYVDENGWKTSGQTISGYPVYYSNSNYHTDSSQAKCTVHFKGYSTFTFYARSYGERNYDYLIVGDIDKTLTVTTRNNRHSAPNAKSDGNFSGKSSTSYTTLSFTGLDSSVEHTFDLIYVKDSSDYDNDDRAYFYLPYRLGQSGSSSIESISVQGDTVVQNNYCHYTIQTVPADTLLDAVEWSITNGSEYASINHSTGLLRLNENANESAITIRATSVYNTSIYGTKDITGTYIKALTNLNISGPDTVNDGSTTAQYSPVYNPEDTFQTGVTWSITSGARYASIDPDTGLLTIEEGAVESNVTVRATSTANPDIYATKIVTLTYVIPLQSLSINGPDVVNDVDFENEAFYYALLTPANTSQVNVGWAIVTGNEYASISNRGVLSVKEGANNSTVVIRARSNNNPAIQAAKTISVTYTSQENPPVYYSVGTLSGWERSTAKSPTGEYIYRSTNTGATKNEATASITFSGLTVIVIYARSDAEAGYDYLVVGDLDKVPTRKDSTAYANAEWNDVYYSFILNNTTDETEFTPIIYTNVDPTVQHTVTLKFLKDDATNRGADRGFFYVPNAENTPQAANKLKGLEIVGPNQVLLLDGMAEQFSVQYNPSYTVQTGVRWEITSGSEYAFIDPKTGEIFANRNADKSAVTIRATSTTKPTLYAEKNILITYTTKLYLLFEDSNVEALCLANFDNDRDGVITYEEAASVTSVGTIFSGKTNITSFNEFKYFSGVTSLQAGAFRGCTNLVSIELPESITTIGASNNGSSNGVFYGNTNLETVVCGPNLTTIGNYAFGNCTNCVIYLKNTTRPSASNSSFGSQNSYISILFVPEQSFNNYSGTSPYSTLNSSSRLKPWNP